MTTKHTPGPWQAVRMYSDALTVLDPKGFEIVEATRTAILPDYEERLGVGHWALSEQAHRDLSDEEQAANARLIAAAPDLLAAGMEAAGSLSAAMEIMTRLGYGRTANVMQAYHDALVAAIAKAKGEQQ